MALRMRQPPRAAGVKGSPNSEDFTTTVLLQIAAVGQRRRIFSAFFFMYDSILCSVVEEGASSCIPQRFLRILLHMVGRHESFRIVQNPSALRAAKQIAAFSGTR